MRGAGAVLGAVAEPPNGLESSRIKRDRMLRVR